LLTRFLLLVNNFLIHQATYLYQDIQMIVVRQKKENSVRNKL